jgi:hypothetical protein
MPHDADFATAFARLRFQIEKGCAAEVGWPARVAAGTRAALAFAAANPEASRRLISEPLAQGAGGIILYESLIAYLVGCLEPGREQRPENSGLPDITERSAVGGVVTLVAYRLDTGREDELPALVPEAIQFMLTPYLGADQARRIATESRRR